MPVPKDQLIELNLGHGKACMFCGRKEISEKAYGLLYQLNGVVVHYFCIVSTIQKYIVDLYFFICFLCFQLLSSRAVQKGSDKEGLFGFLLKDIQTELLRGSREVYNILLCII